MSVNFYQLFGVWIVAIVVTVSIALSNNSPEIEAGSTIDLDDFILEASRFEADPAQLVADQLADLLMSAEDRLASEKSEGIDTEALGTIEEGSTFPQVSAILIERGASMVYLRTDDGLLILTEGGTWDDWVVERILADQVFFSRLGEQYDYPVFASTGEAASLTNGAPADAKEKKSRKKRPAKSKTAQ